MPEIVLTGVNLGWYRDRSEAGFYELLRRILGVLKRARLRVSSLEPCDVNAELAEITLHPRFCNFLHVPLQSGSREILRRMRRTYNPDSFRKRIETVLRVNPDVFLGTDVIAGFPGETEADFAQTFALCEELGVANIHAFRFSARRGTPAASMGDLPDRSLLRERMARLAELRERNWRKYASRFLGTVRERGTAAQPDHVEAAVERSPDSHEGRALTDNFLHLRFEPGPESPSPGDLASFRLGKIRADRWPPSIVSNVTAGLPAS